MVKGATYEEKYMRADQVYILNKPMVQKRNYNYHDTI